MSLLESLLDWERREPSRTWLVQADKRYSFAEAAREVRSIAEAINAWQLPRGSRIAIAGRNTAHWILCDLAISMAGHAAVGMYPRQGKPATDYIFEHAEITHVFVGPSLLPGDAEEFVAGLPTGVVSIAMPYEGGPVTTHTWQDFIQHRLPLAAATTPDKDDLALLVYTSGAAGNPKGVMLSHSSVDWAVQNVIAYGMERGQQDVFLSYLPLAHLMERIFGEAMSLAVGAEMHFLEKPELLAATLQKVAPTRFAGVPLVYSRIQAGVLSKIPQAKLDRMLSIPIFGSWFKGRIRKKMGLHRCDAPGVGAAAMPKDQIDWFEKLGLSLYQGYGMTENCAYTALEKPGARRAGSVGKPLPGSGFRLSPEGEIQVKHPAVMLGYFKDPERTREAFTEDGWLRTGDRGKLDADGYLYVVGRIKEEFKTSKGKYIVPAVIEAKLARNTDLEHVCVMGVGLNQPILLATLNEKGKARPRLEVQADLERDLRAVNNELEDHERLAQCLIVDETWTPNNGFTTPTGKLKRAKVEDFYADPIRSIADKREPLVKWAVELQTQPLAASTARAV
jgi:long-chain acyl-CoA synthetase